MRDFVVGNSATDLCVCVCVDVECQPQVSQSVGCGAFVSQNKCGYVRIRVCVLGILCNHAGSVRSKIGFCHIKNAVAVEGMCSWLNHALILSVYGIIKLRNIDRFLSLINPNFWSTRS